MQTLSCTYSAAANLEMVRQWDGIAMTRVVERMGFLQWIR